MPHTAPHPCHTLPLTHATLCPSPMPHTAPHTCPTLPLMLMHAQHRPSPMPYTGPHTCHTPPVRSCPIPPLTHATLTLMHALYCPHPCPTPPHNHAPHCPSTLPHTAPSLMPYTAPHACPTPPLTHALHWPSPMPHTAPHPCSTPPLHSCPALTLTHANDSANTSNTSTRAEPIKITPGAAQSLRPPTRVAPTKKLANSMLIGAAGADIAAPVPGQDSGFGEKRRRTRQSEQPRPTSPPVPRQLAFHGETIGQ